jgi:sterol 3beta-glucosyltransferase
VPGSLVGGASSSRGVSDGLVAVRVLILTFGTLGDIRPFVALAKGLRAAGHEVGVCTAEGFRNLVVGAGVDYVHMGNEMLDLVQSEMPRMRGASDALRLVSRMSAAMKSALLDQWAAACEFRPSLLVYHPKMLGGLHIAERLRVPAVVSLPLPFLTPTRAFPIPFVAHWPFGGSANKLSYQFNRFTAVAYGGMINSFRRKTLGLSTMSRGSDYLRFPDGRPVPVLYGFSSHVVPVPGDYPAHAHVTGYWVLDEPETSHPPAELVDFLAAGEPPVYIGFGSMGFGRHARTRGQIVIDAAKKARVRAVVATGWGGLEVDSVPDGVHVVEAVPHSWLFPQTVAVVHHGGAGTTAAGLLAGRPTLVCPVLGDQGFWAQRVKDLDVGPAPLPVRRLSVDELADRLRMLGRKASYRSRAQAVSEDLLLEDGVANAVRVLEHMSSTNA